MPKLKRETARWKIFDSQDKTRSMIEKITFSASEKRVGKEIDVSELKMCCVSRLLGECAGGCVFFFLHQNCLFYVTCPVFTHTVRHAHTFLLTCAKTQFVFKGKCFYMSNFNSAISQMEPCQCEFLLPCPLTSAFSSLPYKQWTTQRFISTICVLPRAANWKSITGFDCELQQSSRDVRGWPGLICLHWG